MEKYTIETKRLIIRNFTENDWKDLFEYLSRSQIYIYEPGRPITEEESRKKALERSGGDNFFAVVLKENMKMIGHLYFQKIDPAEFMTFEIGFIFNPEYQRMGYAKEAAGNLIGHAFRKKGVHRIIAECNPENTASWKLLEGIGMRREGHSMQSGFFRRDEEEQPLWFNSYQYAILNNESVSKNKY